eukprot:TRINITY_DN11910_c0_g5_i1.p1 TRINITY_DN11910_c0_g5~~TRINITY_DN11910_c0_g5_i1.p1  ORF type:complete len:679 (-),score=59.24 TRINITY_DN11910_c0_g5_i1:137-2173(-)
MWLCERCNCFCSELFPCILLRMVCFTALDIRFPPGEEKAYTSSIEPEFLRRSFCLVLLLCFVSIGRLIAALVTVPFEGFGDPRIMILASMGIDGLLCLGCLTLVCLRRHTRYVGAIKLNRALIFLFACLIIGCEWKRVTAVAFVGESRSLPQNDAGIISHLQFVDLADRGTSISRMCFLMLTCQTCFQISACNFLVLPVVAIISYSIASSIVGWSDEGSLEFLFFLLVFCVYFAKAAYNQESLSRTSWKSAAKVEEQHRVISTMETASSNILAHFCDSIFHIDRDSKILEADLRLSASLMVDGDDRLIGRSLTDFMETEDDVERFTNAINALTVQIGALEVLSVHLRDTRARVFQVHAHFSPYERDSGGTRFLVGFVEAQERAADTFVSTDIIPRVIGRACSDSRSNSERSRSSSVLSNPLLDSVSSNIEEVEVCLIADRALTIKSTSAGFTNVTGPLHANQSFLDFVKEKATKVSLAKWVDRVRALYLEEMHFEKGLVLRTSQGRLEHTVENCALREVSIEPQHNRCRDQLCMRLKLGRVTSRPRQRPKPKQMHKPPRLRDENSRISTAQAKQRVRRRFDLTLEEAYNANLMKCLSRSCCPFNDDFDCCTLHAAVNMLRRQADRLAMSSCIEIYEDITGQCANCGCLCKAEDDMSDDEYECTWCGGPASKFKSTVSL